MPVQRAGIDAGGDPFTVDVGAGSGTAGWKKRIPRACHETIPNVYPCIARHHGRGLPDRGRKSVIGKRGAGCDSVCGWQYGYDVS